MNQTDILLSLFEYWGCGLTRKKLLKTIKRALRQQFAMGTKNVLLEAKAK